MRYGYGAAELLTLKILAALRVPSYTLKMDSKGSFELQHMLATDNIFEACCTITSFKAHTSVRSKLATRAYILHFILIFLVTSRSEGARFSAPSRPSLRPTQPPLQWVPGHFPGVKRPGRGGDQPPTSSAEVKERVQPYPYSTSFLDLLSYNTHTHTHTHIYIYIYFTI